ncbi:MAG: DUF4350 domain-containing protein [Ignavibacteriaceae bacterium]|nr:DUF4350 domain-containing protein [Ignavibacteriaceae bacterium]
MKSYRIYLVVIAILFFALIFLEVNRPEKINWERSFKNSDTIPFGTEILFKHLPELFPKVQIKQNREPFYNAFSKDKNFEKTTFLLISDSFSTANFAPDSNDLEHLFKFVANGNTAFIAANDFPKRLLDTLHLELKLNNLIKSEVVDKEATKIVELDTLTINLVNRTLAPIWYYRLEKETGENVFKPQKKKPLVANILGENKHKQANFLKVRFGKGYFFLHSVPEIFTNYYLLKYPSNPYSAKALSYVDSDTILWDEYTKQGRVGEQSLTRYIESVPSLKWAYYLVLLGVFIYIFVERKRKQRIIPIINPPANDSLEFVKTVGQLYFQKGNHHNLALKKIHHFKHFVWKITNCFNYL